MPPATPVPGPRSFDATGGRSVGGMADAAAEKPADDAPREVIDVPDDHRYEIRVAGELAGFAVYHRRGGRAYFVHTEVDPRFEGRGLGPTPAKGLPDAGRAA